MRYLILFIFLISSLPSLAQSGAQKRSDKSVEKGKEAEKQRNIQLAQRYYHEALAKFPQNKEALHRIGLIQRLYENNVDSMLWAFEQLAALSPLESKYYPTLFYLSEALFRKGRYMEAKRHLTAYIQLENPQGKNEQVARALLRDLDYAITNQLRSDLRAPREILQIEGAPDNMYFPEITPDRSVMIFTALINGQEDIFIAKPDANHPNSWSSPTSISANINTRENEGACALSADGRTLILTACNRRDGLGSCDLYIAYKQGDEWSKPINMGRNINTGEWESQPSLSADGRTLYFCSNRRGGYGNRDIYVSYFKNGEWTPARNLGPQINTPGDEISPYIYVDGKTLFFSSNAYPSFGGFDVYYSQLDKTWSQPENVGNHINDHHDQISLFISADQQEIYFSQEQRKGKISSTSIFRIDPLAIADLPLEQNGWIRGRISDKKTKESLRAKIQLYDLAKDSLIYEVQSDPVTGQYLVVVPYEGDFSVYAQAKDYSFNSMVISVASVSANYEADIALEAIEKGVKVTLNNLYFGFDSSELTERSMIELVKIKEFLDSNPNVHILIGGYTDATGSAAYNLKLSQLRADSVRMALIKLGIQPDRLTAKGFGSESSDERSRKVVFFIAKS
jgi:OmpA-OmpF porin, OOP family